jgi:hypothetical protein
MVEDFYGENKLTENAFLHIKIFQAIFNQYHPPSCLMVEDFYGEN